jgi:hypothetical protein
MNEVEVPASTKCTTRGDNDTKVSPPHAHNRTIAITPHRFSHARCTRGARVYFYHNAPPPSSAHRTDASRVSTHTHILPHGAVPGLTHFSTSTIHQTPPTYHMASRVWDGVSKMFCSRRTSTYLVMMRHRSEKYTDRTRNPCSGRWVTRATTHTGAHRQIKTQFTTYQSKCNTPFKSLVGDGSEHGPWSTHMPMVHEHKLS